MFRIFLFCGSPDNFESPIHSSNLHLQQKERQQSAGQHTKQMEELRRRHQNIPGAHQIVVGDDRPVLRMMDETLARYQGGAALRRRLLPRMLVRPIVEVLVRMLVGIVVHIAEVDLELVVARLHQRMHDLDPIGLVRFNGVRPAGYVHMIRPVRICVAVGGGYGDGRRRPTEELTVPRRWRRVNDARHEPRGGDFAKENQQNGAHLPAAEFTVDVADDVDFFHGRTGRLGRHAMNGIVRAASLVEQRRWRRQRW